MSLGLRFLRLNCRHRDRIVIGSFEDQGGEQEFDVGRGLFQGFE